MAVANSSGSLVTDILQKSGALDKQDLSTSVSKLSQKSVEVKAQVYEAIYKQYTEFIHSYNLTMELNSKVEELSTDLKSLNSVIKGDVESKLQKANNIYTNISQQLTDTNVVISVLQKLCKIHDVLSEVQSLKDCKDYEKMSTNLSIVKKGLDDLPKSGDELKILKVLRERYQRYLASLVSSIEKSWVIYISWKIPTTSSLDNMDGHLKTQLNLAIITGNEVDIDQVLQTTELLKRLDAKLKEFGKKLIQFIIQPIVIFQRLKLVISETKQSVELKLAKDNAKTENAGVSIFDKLSKLFEVLSSTFLSKTVKKSTENVTEEKTLLFLLGKVTWPALSSCLIKECLAKSIPKTTAQLEKYGKVVNATVKFEETLVKIGFIPEGTDTLKAYSKDITTHFSNKKCEDLLFTAREMLKTDINFRDTHVITEGAKNVTPLKDLFNVKKSDHSGKKEHVTSKSSDENKEDKKSIDKMFMFPTCCVSKCIPPFLALAYKSLVEATETKNVQLFYTVRQMFELYRYLVPTYYEDDLKELPQISALNYNNCMYLSHHLVTLGHQFRPKLPPPLNGGAGTFIDLVSPTRQLGEKCFDDQLRKQSNSLLEIIESAGSFQDLQQSTMENAIQRVLFQLRKLSKVWYSILPLNIYDSSLGALINAVLKKFIDEIVKLEDISSDDAHSLDDLTTTLVDKIPGMVKISDENIDKVVGNWKKFLELRFVINGSLQVIEDRWADGKGLLAEQFTCNEIRGLIRALFQNTDLRAAVLAKIRPAQN